MQPEKIAHCAGCKREMYLLPNGDWCFLYYEDTHKEWDGPLASFLTTDEPLREAVTFWNRVVCSHRCASDAAYNRASESDKRTMRVLRDACYAILDQPDEPVKWKVTRETEALIAAAKEWLASHGCDNKDSYPDWMNEMTREDRLDRAARHVAEKLEKDAGVLGYGARVSAEMGGECMATGEAADAAHAALMALELREALEEK